MVAKKAELSATETDLTDYRTALSQRNDELTVANEQIEELHLFLNAASASRWEYNKLRRTYDDLCRSMRHRDDFLKRKVQNQAAELKKMQDAIITRNDELYELECEFDKVCNTNQSLINREQNYIIAIAGLKADIKYLEQFCVNVDKRVDATLDQKLADKLQAALKEAMQQLTADKC